MSETYESVKIGDRVVVFSYWNTRPEWSGEVVALTEHFVEIEDKRFLNTRKEWVSRAKIEVVKPTV